jgi:hypothetical protein
MPAVLEPDLQIHRKQAPGASSNQSKLHVSNFDAITKKLILFTNSTSLGDSKYYAIFPKILQYIEIAKDAKISLFVVPCFCQKLSSFIANFLFRPLLFCALILC